MDRRDFLLSTFATGALRAQLVASSAVANSQMLVEYFVRRLNSSAREMEAQRSRVRTAAQVRYRNQNIRARLVQMLGFQFPKQPLSPSRTATLERADYKIENVVFQSRPGFWVPANVYVPRSSPGPFPAVLIQRGHFNAERMFPDYQQLYVDLVAAGFLVLTFDPIGQGERRQYYGNSGEIFDDSLSPTLEHCAIGSLLLLIGESAAGHFAWDGIRAIDYLASRPDVRAERIGLADHTDTGWSSIYLAAVDRRIKAAAVHVHGSARRWPIDPLSWNLIDDSEQQLFPAARLLVDDLDILAAIAPRPLLTLVEDQTSEFDYGANYLRTCYRLLGTAESVAVERAHPSPEWPRDLRLAAVRWLTKSLAVGSIVEKEIDATPERYVALRVTPVSGEPSLGQPIYRYISNKAAAFARTPASGAVLGKLREELERLMGPRFDAVAFAPMETYSQRLSTFSISRIEFTSEPGIRIPALLYQPSPSSGSCVIYASGDVTAVGGVFDGDDDASGGQEPDNPLSPFARKMVERGVTVLAVDVRGIGLTSPAASRRDYRGKYEHLHNSDVALANMAWSLGESLIAMRVKDLLRAIEFGSQFGKVHLAGVDMGAIWAIFAGALDSRVASVSVQGVLASFRMLAERARFLHSPSQFVPGLLKWMDLPQIAGLIAPRPLAILNVLNQEKELLELGTARKAFEWTSEVYRSLGAERSLTIAASRELSDFVKL